MLTLWLCKAGRRLWIAIVVWTLFVFFAEPHLPIWLRFAANSFVLLDVAYSWGATREAKRHREAVAKHIHDMDELLALAHRAFELLDESNRAHRGQPPREIN